MRIDGVDVRRIALASLGREIGVVTQETYLFHDTVLANLRYAQPDATQDEIETAARAARHPPAHHPSSRRATTRSSASAATSSPAARSSAWRSLACSSRTRASCILDEATSALDTVSERLIQGALAGLMEGRTTIAIAHRLSTILRANLILVMERGRIVERGTHDELVRHEGLYARLYAEQFASERPV